MSVGIGRFNGVSITIHRATRLDHLARELGEVLRATPPDPFATELVVVPAWGVRRWLTQMLSHHLGGISAGIDFRAPSSLVSLFLGPDEDPWDPAALAWWVLEVVDECAEQEWLRPVSTHLGLVTTHAGLEAHGEEAQGEEAQGEEDPDRSGRRYTVARRIAQLFASYAAERPTMVRAWLEGAATDRVEELDAGFTWQMTLFQELARRLPTPPTPLRVSEALRRAQQERIPRLHVFGHTRLSHTDLELLEGLGEQADVHVWVPHPSPALWEGHDGARPEAGPATQAAQNGPADDRHGAARNPLLQTLGVESRALSGRLGGLPAEIVTVDEPGGAQQEPPSLLGQLQGDIRDNREPGLPAAPAPLPADGSVQVHACHGASRQVEVLRDLLVGLMEDNPGLEPRDVLILCPDVEAYAPLFDAAFGPLEGEAHPGHRLRLGLADRNRAATNPLLELASVLMNFTGGRVRSSELIDLFHRDEVRRRFAFTERDVETLTEWVRGSGMRWGLTSASRERFRVGITQNTIEAGLSRLLLGVTMAETGNAVNNVLPYDDVGSTDITLLGGFAEFLDRLRGGLSQLDTAATVAEWAGALEGLVSAVSCAAHPWQESAFAAALTRVARGGGARASRADFRRVLEDLSQPSSSSANLRTGALTVASLVPMRSVPHKVVCLVGMDDGAFPRGAAFDGDDVLARRPLPGERDRRIEDRQLFLDALMSATDHLLITYSGSGTLRGEEQYPAVPVAELIDAMALTTGQPGASLITRHPLHSFDSRYFSGEERLVSFDAVAAAAASGRAAPVPRPPFLTGVLEPVEQTAATLTELRSFFSDPVRSFIRDRVGISLGGEYDPVEDSIPTSLTGLDAWKVGDRLLTRTLEHGVQPHLLTAERLRGQVPPGTLGGRDLRAIANQVAALTHAAERFREGSASAVDVDVTCAGTRLEGRVGNIYGNRIVHVSYSTLAPKHVFQAWLDLLALTVHYPQQVWEAVVIGRNKKEAKATLLTPVDPESAREHLADLLDIRSRGLREPLPLPPETAAAWAEGVYRMGDRDTRARREGVKVRANYKWQTQWTWTREDQDPYQLLAWGKQLTLEELLAMPPGPQEAWNSEPTRLGQYALRMWGPVLQHERF